MITKAIIEEVISEDSVRVRIPLIHKIVNVSGSTPFSELPVATICTMPGLRCLYDVGDVVYVAYEDKQSAKIVVLGELSVNFDTGAYTKFNSVIDGGGW